MVIVRREVYGSCILTGPLEFFFAASCVIVLRAAAVVLKSMTWLGFAFRLCDLLSVSCPLVLLLKFSLFFCWSIRCFIYDRGLL